MFAENAAIKAHAAAKATGLPALSDDSGLCVDALDGAPGLFTADWAGPERDFSTAMARVERGIAQARHADPDDRKAHFVSALVIAWPDGHEELFEGRVFGQVVWPPRGDKGLRLRSDVPAGRPHRTFGEMSSEEKHGIDWSQSRAAGPVAPRPGLRQARQGLPRADPRVLPRPRAGGDGKA